MVSVPQSRLTDLLRRKTFFSLPSPCPVPPFYLLPAPKASRREWARGLGMLDRPWRMARRQLSCALLPSTGMGTLLGAGRGKRAARNHTWLGFLWQGSLVCAFFLCSKKSPWKRPGEPDQMYWLWAKAWLLRPGTLRSQVFISVLLKLIGKVNEINMAKRCALLRRKGPDTCCPRGNYGPVHFSWGRFIELSSSKTWLFLLDNSKVGCIQG